MKKHLYLAEAERLYVVEQFSIEAIAQRLGLSSRTIHLWAQQNDWKRKRIQHLKKVALVHQELYLLLARVVKSVKEDLLNNKKVDPARLNFIKSLAPVLLKLKEYELENKDETQSKKEIPPETIQMIEKLLNLK